MTPPQSDVLTIETLTVDDCEDGTVVALVTINRPNKLNALNADVTSAMKEMVAWGEAEDLVRCIIITGAQPLEPEEGRRAKPNAFAAGADITEFLGAGSEEITVKFTDNAIEALWNISKPTIAMVDGFALGGGTELALSCDMRIASSRSKFGQPEINLGLIPGGGGTQRLTSLVGYGAAIEMVLTGDMVSAERALQMGLVNKVVSSEDLRDSTLKIARNIASKSPYTIKVAKRAIRSSLDLPLSQGMLAERSEFVALFDTEDSSIGVEAFLSKKEPEWVGR